MQGGLKFIPSKNMNIQGGQKFTPYKIMNIQGRLHILENYLLFKKKKKN